MAKPPMKIIALATGKGGAAKSTTAINLACEAIRSRELAMIIDMDEGQQSSARWAVRRGGSPPEVVVCGSFKLKAELQKMRDRGVVWVFLDLPGRNDSTMTSGIAASDFVLIPSRPQMVDLEPSVKAVESAMRAGKPYAYLMSVVPPQGDRSRTKRFMEALDREGHAACPISIGLKQDVPDAFTVGLSAGEYKAGCSSQVEFKMVLSWLRGKLK